MIKTNWWIIIVPWYACTEVENPCSSWGRTVISSQGSSVASMTIRKNVCKNDLWNAVLKLQNLSWSSFSCFISMCPITCSEDLLNHSIKIIFCPAATAPKRRVILYAGTWRLNSLLLLEVLGFLAQPPAQQTKHYRNILTSECM